MGVRCSKLRNATQAHPVLQDLNLPGTLFSFLQTKPFW